MGWWGPGRGEEDVRPAEIVERLRWLLRLRWLAAPASIAAVMALDVVRSQKGSPGFALGLGGAIIASNCVYLLLLARKAPAAWLLAWARLEAFAVVALAANLPVLGCDAGPSVRFGVLVGLASVAALLPRGGEVALLTVWAMLLLVVGDAITVGFDLSLLPPATFVRWVIECGVVLATAAILIQMQHARESASRRAARTDEDLRSARAEWDAALDGLAEAVVVTDHDGRVVRANRAFARLVGQRPRELALRPLREILAGHPDRWWTGDRDGISEIEDPVFDSAFEVTATRLGDRVVRVARDVGEARRLQARIVEADKLSGVGALAAGVAHELNNPTTFVTANLLEVQRYVAAYEGAVAELSTLGLEAGVAERVRELLARLEVSFARRECASAVSESLTGMERVRQLVANFRSLARPVAPGAPAAPVDLGEVVQAVARTAAADLRKASARVEAAGPAWVFGRRGELEDVVLNLVVNAIQAREEERPNRISISLRQEQGAVVLAVSDTGKGISPGHLKRLFQPCFTTKSPAEGTGIGLSLVRRIVLAHGGTIDVTSQPGAGSTFTVRLPRHEPGSAPGTARLESGAA